MFEHELGPNRQLIGATAAEFARHAATPALCLDQPAFTANLAAMQAAVTAAGRSLRPHMKAHKSTHIARLQRDAGAIGICCATAKEAETAARAGVASILVTTPIASPMVLTRLAELARSVEVILVVDTGATLELAGAAAAAAAATFGILVDVNLGQNRTGIGAPGEAVVLARRARDTASLHFRGIQGYYGHLQHVPTLADRRAKVAEQLRQLVAVRDALVAAGETVDIVSGGGTGTAELDLDIGPFTEIQPGSYLFMDDQYDRVERRAVPLACALTVLARVTSDAVPGQVVVDAGTKALSTDPAQVRLAGVDAPVEHRFMGDEHSALRYPDGVARPRVGTLVNLIATHCDPTVNLHGRLHVMEGGRLVDIWPLEARGY